MVLKNFGTMLVLAMQVEVGRFQGQQSHPNEEASKGIQFFYLLMK